MTRFHTLGCRWLVIELFHDLGSAPLIISCANTFYPCNTKDFGVEIRPRSPKGITWGGARISCPKGNLFPGKVTEFPVPPEDSSYSHHHCILCSKNREVWGFHFTGKSSDFLLFCITQLDCVRWGHLWNSMAVWIPFLLWCVCVCVSIGIQGAECDGHLLSCLSGPPPLCRATPPMC
jgi:hypothetical protein